MGASRKRTRSVERRLLDEAKQRVSGEMAQLSALQLDLQRAQERYRDAIDRIERRRELAEAELAAFPHERNRVATNGAASDGPATNGVASDGPPGDESDRPLKQRARVRLRSAGYADLRALGLSVTQANRVLDYVRAGPRTVAELCRVEWLPRDLRAQLAQRLSD